MALQIVEETFFYPHLQGKPALGQLYILLNDQQKPKKSPSRRRLISIMTGSITNSNGSKAGTAIDGRAAHFRTFTILFPLDKTACPTPADWGSQSYELADF